MGAVYLTYSAYYVSINITGMKIFIGFILNLLYLVLCAVVMRNCQETRLNLQAQLNAVRDEDIVALQEALKLKMKMMNTFMVIAGFYFFYELVINGLLPTLESASDQFNPYENVI